MEMCIHDVHAHAHAHVHSTRGACTQHVCLATQHVCRRLLDGAVAQHRLTTHPHVGCDALPLARRVVGPERRQVQHVTRPQRRTHRRRARRPTVGGVGGGGAGGGLGGGVRYT